MNRSSLATVATVAVATACATSEATTSRWNGSVDTLPSGHIVVENTADPIWTVETQWTVTEDLRIGSLEDDGPDLFGRIMALEVDSAGRIYVLESQANELRIFDANGSHVTTAGRDGGGPGEFARPLMMSWGRDGNLWIVDPNNNRISIFDREGGFVTSRPSPGGFTIIPWPGGFDRAGNYYSPIPLGGEDFRLGLLRYDTAFIAHDTLAPPTDPIEREYFEQRTGDGFMRASIPEAGGFTWRLSPRGTMMGMVRDNYRLFEIDQQGDTLRTIRRAFDPLPVMAEDHDSARVSLEWFVRQGGRIDLSKMPNHKPATRYLFWDDEDNLWVIPVTPHAQEGRIAHVFDPEGRFLGEVTFPFRLSSRPYPIIRHNIIHAVTMDEFDVPFVVRARLSKP